MSFIGSLELMRQVISLGLSANKVYSFVSASHDVIMTIGSNEFNVAKQSLDNMKISNNPLEELLMAISHLKSALEHFKSKAKSSFRLISEPARRRSCETALLISICYKLRGENRLSYEYFVESTQYFCKWINGFHIHYSCGKSILRRIESDYEETKREIIKFGLKWPYSKPEIGFFDGLWNESRHIDELHAIFDSHIDLIVRQYKDFANGLIL